MKLSVVIPVYNEESTIDEVVRQVLNTKIPIEKEIIIVDDGSTDRTPRILRKYKKNKIITVITSVINIGKGIAVRIGFEQATGDIVIVQDADLELDPEEYLQLIQPILDGDAKVVYGSRFLGTRKIWWTASFFANKFLVILTNLLYNSSLTDVETSFKVISEDVLDKIKLRCIGFEFEPEITAKLLRLGYRIVEVPISYHPRTIEEGKKVNWMDGIKAVYYLLKYRLVEINECKR